MKMKEDVGDLEGGLGRVRELETRAERWIEKTEKVIGTFRTLAASIRFDKSQDGDWSEANEEQLAEYERTISFLGRRIKALQHIHSRRHNQVCELVIRMSRENPADQQTANSDLALGATT